MAAELTGWDRVASGGKDRSGWKECPALWVNTGWMFEMCKLTLARLEEESEDIKTAMSSLWGEDKRSK